MVLLPWDSVLRRRWEHPGGGSRSSGGCPRLVDSGGLVSRSVACCQACGAVFQIAPAPGTSRCLLTSLPAGVAEFEFGQTRKLTGRHHRQNADSSISPDPHVPSATALTPSPGNRRLVFCPYRSACLGMSPPWSPAVRSPSGLAAFRVRLTCLTRRGSVLGPVAGWRPSVWMSCRSSAQQMMPVWLVFSFCRLRGKPLNICVRVFV